MQRGGEQAAGGGRRGGKNKQAGRAGTGKAGRYADRQIQTYEKQALGAERQGVTEEGKISRQM